MLDFDKDVNDYLCETIKLSARILGFSCNWHKASDLKIKKSEDAQNDIINIVNFFGGENYLEKNNFSDLAIPYNSREIRELYNKKLFQMIEIDTSDFNDSFFTEKL